MSRFAEVLERLAATIAARKGADAASSYTAQLLADPARAAKKLGEEAVERGAGEILLTSMDRDGAKIGYDLQLLKAVSSAVSVPVIASGGAGGAQHTVEAVRQGGADAVLAASIFHFGEATVGQAHAYLRARGVPVREEVREATP